MSNSKNKIQYRERNSNNKNACFLSFMYYFNFDSSAEFIQKAQYTCKSSNKYPSTRENQFFFHVYACTLSRKHWKQTKCIILCDGEKQLYFFQD